MRYLQKTKEITILCVKSILKLCLSKSIVKSAVNVIGKRTVEQQTGWLDYIKDRVWSRLEFCSSEMEFALAYREVWRLEIELTKKRVKKRKNTLLFNYS